MRKLILSIALVFLGLCSFAQNVYLYESSKVAVEVWNAETEGYDVRSENEFTNYLYISTVATAIYNTKTSKWFKATHTEKLSSERTANGNLLVIYAANVVDTQGEVVLVSLLFDENDFLYWVGVSSEDEELLIIYKEIEFVKKN